MKSISKSCPRSRGLEPRHVLSILVVIVLTLASITARAQQPQPPAPSDTVFPIGGLTWGIDSSNIPGYLAHFGMNMLRGALPGMIGATDRGALGFLLPGGTYGIGNNPLFDEADLHLASNETGGAKSGGNDPAWDLAPTFTNDSTSKYWELTEGGINLVGSNPSNNNEWFIPGGPTSPSLTYESEPGFYLVGLNVPQPYDSTKTYSSGNLVTDSVCSARYWIYKNNTPPSSGHAPGCSSAYWSSQTWGNQNIESYLGTNDSTMQGIAPPVSKFYIDFVYRFDTSQYTTTPDSAYDLEVQVNWSDGSTPGTLTYSVNDGGSWATATTIDPITNDFVIPIRVSDYKSYVVVASPADKAAHDIAAHPKENPNLLRFPTPGLNPPPPLPQHIPEPYAVLRIEVSCNGKMLATNPAVCPITVNLKGANPEGIYVRGVRIRSDWADDFFRGYFDDTSKAPDGNDLHALNSGFPTGGLNAEFKIIHDTSGTGWAKTLAFIVGNEGSWMEFRCLAHINELFRAYSVAHGGVQKDLTTILTGGFNVWRSIYEDESKTNAPPPILQNESIGIGAGYPFYNPDQVFNPGDQIAGRPDHDFLPRHSWYSGGPVYGAASPDREREVK